MPEQIKINPPDRTALLLRIAAEKDRVVSEFMRRMRLLQQQEAALTMEQQPTEPPRPLVRTWEHGRRA